jgi:hypothetical protein
MDENNATRLLMKNLREVIEGVEAQKAFFVDEKMGHHAREMAIAATKLEEAELWMMKSFLRQIVTESK